ncbi:iron uptake porin [Cyanobium sp. Aljojuca 7D2]|uniref:iron uptake porin n=1 Tax=Cyanobium sp. Aljojuca 7D2 TaxID=2823698 RepID=UPI0028F4016A|nr:iron uptake porin [Cyanobium sp. Aljojuca 7D2]
MLPAVIAPETAAAGELASLNGREAINDYMEQQEIDELKAWRSKNQVTSVNQFSDIRPTDWAYQALSNLVEKYGCVAGYPNGTYKGGQAMTRYEAAALLNACLDRVTEVTDELQRLMDEFKKELAVLKGRVDGLEAQVGELEAQQFSTTTKLRGKADMIIGATNYTGDVNQNFAKGSGSSVAGKAKQEAFTFNYRLTLDLDTSFTGKDLLYTRLRAGNFSGNFSGDPIKLTQLEDSNTNADFLKVDKLWYQFPVGDSKGANGMIFVGPRIEGYYMLASMPTLYGNGNFILKEMKGRGASGVYGNSTGAGFGAWWRSTRNSSGNAFSVSSNYVAQSGSNSGIYTTGTGANTIDYGDAGLFNQGSQSKFITQLAYGNGNNWQVSAAYAWSSGGATMGFGTPTGGAVVGVDQTANSLALNAYWQPENSGWIPSISLGYGVNWFSGGNTAERSQTMEWLVGFEWDDIGADGNTLGLGFSGPQWVSQGTASNGDTGLAVELWYKYQVTDNISITPAVFYLSNPLGSSTVGDFGTIGYLMKTTFRF